MRHNLIAATFIDPPFCGTYIRPSPSPSPSSPNPTPDPTKTQCAFCGQDNDPAARYCLDCGKPLTASARAQAGSAGPVFASGVPVTRVAQAAGPGGSTESWPKCRKCGNPVDPLLPFCGHCAAPQNAEAAECSNCRSAFIKGSDLFCNKCGTRVGQRVSVLTHAQSSGAIAITGIEGDGGGPRIAILDERGEPTKVLKLDRGEAVIGRGDADIKFEKDVYLSPLHARIDLDGGQLWLRDLGSRNGSWVFIEEATKLIDGDLILIGSQVLRFRRLGYPGPHPPEADSTRRMGSTTPNVDVAILEQLRADGSVRDVLHLSPGRNALIGRETGDWIFPYDQTMSARHAEIVSEDIEFFVNDAGSRNGVAMSVRGDRELKAGQRFLLGDQILRVENV